MFEFYKATEPEHEACSRCYKVTHLEGHHVMKRSTGGKEVVLLCRECHNWVEGNPHKASLEGFHDGRYKMKGKVYGKEEKC